MAAPKGNSFALGNSGKHKIFSSADELQDAIDEYFRFCDENTRQVITKEGDLVDVLFPIPYTIEGLCDVLECDRKTLLNYEKAVGYEDYFHTIKKAKLKVQRKKVENALMGNSPPRFAIFDLVNNSDYVNTSHTDITSGNEKINTIDPFAKMRENIELNEKTDTGL